MGGAVLVLSSLSQDEEFPSKDFSKDENPYKDSY